MLPFWGGGVPSLRKIGAYSAVNAKADVKYCTVFSGRDTHTIYSSGNQASLDWCCALVIDTDGEQTIAGIAF